MKLVGRNALAFRIVVLAWLFGWFAKAGFYLPQLFGEARRFPFTTDRLPALFGWWALAAAGYVAPLAVLLAVVFPKRFFVRAGSIVLAVSAAIACVHLETFSDATFVTSLWTALWLVWFAFATHDDLSFVRHACLLAQCVIALQFVGPALGKLTREYTSGDAFYHLYFLQKDDWPYPLLRSRFAPQTLHAVAAWASPLVIAFELTLAATPLLQRRLALAITGAGLALIVLTSTWMLISVVASLAGLAGAIVVLGRPAASA